MLRWKSFKIDQLLRESLQTLEQDEKAQSIKLEHENNVFDMFKLYFKKYFNHFLSFWLGWLDSNLLSSKGRCV